MRTREQGKGERGQESEKKSWRTYHHLLNHASGLAIQVTQLGVLGRDFGRVDLCITLKDALPPLRAVELLQIDVELLLVRIVLADQCPGRLAQLDGLVESSLDVVKGWVSDPKERWFSHTAFRPKETRDD